MSQYLLQDSFLKYAQEFPDLKAVVFENESISYGEINEKSNRLAHVILKFAPQEEIIAISTTRKIDMIIGLLAILKTGKTYLPIDPKYPQDRQYQMVKISGVQHVIAGIDESNNWGRLGLTRLDYKTQHDASDLPQVKSNEVYAVFFTSGSTGVPKGVKVTHQGALGLIQHKVKNSLAAGQGIKTLQFCHLGFDVSVKEIFVTLSTGGELHLMNEHQRMDAYFMLDYIRQHHIQTVFLPPVALQYFADAAVKSKTYPTSLLEVNTGGELLKITTEIRELFQELSNTRLVNNYGPTEASIWVSDLVLSNDPQSWPDMPSIGFPMSNHVEFYVLDANLQPVKIGEKGELHLAGECLVKGYLKRDDLTNDKFITWQVAEGNNLRLYKTGDWVSQTDNGDFIFYGREDDQIKIRGNRVELGEIEVALSKVPEINQAIVKLEEIKGQKALVAYLIMNNNAPLNKLKIKILLKTWIPEFMIPDEYVVLQDFPKTNSGKVDRKALKSVGISPNAQDMDTQLLNATIESQILSVFREVLSQPSFGAEDHFFNHGGNSLKAQQTVALLKERYGLNIPVIFLYQAPTADSLAKTQQSESLRPKEVISNKSNAKDVAIVSMAFRFPGANDEHELMNILKNGEEKISFFEENELEPSILSQKVKHANYVKAKGIIDGYDEFDAEFFDFSTKLASITDPQIRKFLEVSYEALEKAGYRKDANSLPIGVFAGAGNNTYLLHHLIHQRSLLESFGDFQVNSLNEKDYLASRVAYHLDLTGPAISVNSACSTALLAVAQAVEAIRNGSCQMALAGAVSIQAPVKAGHLYEDGSVLSKDGRVRAFDKAATGTLFSDGVGVVLLKDLAQARKDGDEILAVVKGVGINNDGRVKSSFSAPSILGQADVIQRALQDAAVAAEEVGFVEAHATATPLGDPIEIQGLKLAFSTATQNSTCALGSIKSNIGHLNAAAGIAGLVKTVLTLKHKVLFPQAGFQSLNPEIQFEGSPFFVSTKYQAWESESTRIAGVSAFGVGGTNVHLVLSEEKTETETEKFSDKLPGYLLPLSAKSEESLLAYTKKLIKYISAQPELVISSIAQALYQRPSGAFRQYLVVKDKNDLLDQLQHFPATLPLAKTKKKPVFLFPGQGAQFINMGKSLYNHFSVFREAVDECESILMDQAGFSIKSLIFSHAPNALDEEKLKLTQFTQPALFVVEYAMAKTLMSLGLKPAYVCGHSIGEYAAANLAGIFSLKDALSLVVKRGHLMGKLNAGEMMAVAVSVEEMQKHLPERLSIAAVNRHNQCVVSGAKDLMAALKIDLQDKGIIFHELSTSHAFHSEMMEGMMEEFAKEVQAVQRNHPSLPLISTVTGNPISAQEAVSVDYWVHQLRTTVNFSAAADNLCHKEEELFFMEVGPGNVLINLLKHAKGYRQQKTFASLAKSADYVDFLKTLGELWKHGQEIDWSKLFASQPPRVMLPGYAFKKHKIWIDAPHALTQTQSETIPSVQGIFENKPLENSFSLPLDAEMLWKNRIKDTLALATGVVIEDEKASFIELGLDSLLLTAMLTALKREFSVSLTFRQLNEELSDFEKLEAYLSFQTDRLPREKTFLENEKLMETQAVLVEREEVALHPLLPPIPGAKLGKDANGEMAWFIRDQNNPGKFLKVNPNVQ